MVGLLAEWRVVYLVGNLVAEMVGSLAEWWVYGLVVEMGAWWDW